MGRGWKWWQWQSRISVGEIPHFLFLSVVCASLSFSLLLYFLLFCEPLSRRAQSSHVPVGCYHSMLLQTKQVKAHLICCVSLVPRCSGSFCVFCVFCSRCAWRVLLLPACGPWGSRCLSACSLAASPSSVWPQSQEQTPLYTV